MCGQLKFEGIAKNRGQSIFCINPILHRRGYAVWDGFAHKEKEDWWKSHGDAVPLYIMADSFVEGTATFKVPEGNVIRGLGLRKNVLVQGRVAGRAKQVKILTRQPLNSFEASIHNRWPVVQTGDGYVYQWTEKDVIGGQVQKELF